MRTTKVRDFGLALIGGVWGGALAGLAEASLIGATAGQLQEFGFVPYAIIGYALLGGLMGIGLAIVYALAGPLRRSLPGPFGFAGGLALAALVFVIGRYNVDQRFFHEELSLFTASGAMAYAGLVVLAAVGFGLVVWAGRWLSHLGWPISSASGALVALAVVAVVIGRARTPSDTTIGPGPVRHADATRPNVILIIADTLRADAVSAYGAANTSTPSIDALAADGVRFAKAYSQASWTRPSIATILTSLHPSVHGAIGKTSILPDRVETVAEAFRGGGYQTAGFVSNINIAPVFNFQQGFAQYTYLPPDFYFWASDSAARLALYRILRVIRERFFASRVYVDNYYKDAQTVTDHAIHWMEHPPRKPFFLLIHYMDPHDPYFEIPYDGRGTARVAHPNPPASERDELHKVYLEDVGYLDQNLARLWKRMKELGLYDNTEIILTADHGEEFREHGGWWHGTTLYEEVVHVPLIVKRVGQVERGTVVPTPVRTLDIAPTLLLAANITPPSSFEGENLFASGDQPRTLWAEEDLEGNVLSSIRVGPWKLITANPNNPRGLQPLELYNLNQDPKETKNLAGSEPQRVQEMLAALGQARDRSEAHGSFGR